MPEPESGPLRQTPIPLIGREREIESVERLIHHDRARLVTLTGTAGAGKTTLALEVAARCRSEFPDGVFVVDLGAISDPALTASSANEALGIRVGPLDEPLATLVAHLRQRHVLLLLDNCEHLIGACAALVRALMAECQHVSVLATSREPLQVPGERQFPVPHLALPKIGERGKVAELASNPCVQLFVERAQVSSPGFALTSCNTSVVGEICVRLEGIPLSIELAAARVRVLALEQIRDRLDDCIRLLGGDSRAAPRRQRTLRGTLDWSYDLLDEAERITLRRLGTFVGWLDLDAAEEVCGEPDAAGEGVLDSLARLADKSLLLVEHRAGRAHYRLLEPIREYARQHLWESGEADAIQTRHLEHYVGVAEELEATIWGGLGDQSEALDRLESLRDNTSAALAWGVVNSPALAARLAGNLWHFWRLRGLVREGRRWLEALLSDDSTLGAGLGKVTVGAAFLSRDPGDIAAAEALSYRAIAIANETGDDWARGMALLNLGIVANLHGDLDTAREHFVECLSCCRQIKHQWGTGSALYHLGYMARLDGNLSMAQNLLEESLAVHHSIGDRRGVSVVLGALGRVYFLLGEADRANAYMEESLAIGERIGIRDNSGLGLAALLARSAGDYVRARELTRQGLDLLFSSGLHQHVPEHLCIQGTLLIDEGAYLPGVRLISAALALGDSSGQIDALVAHTLAESSLDTARSALGEQIHSRAWEEGRLLSLADAVDLATSARPDPPSQLAPTPAEPEPRDPHPPVGLTRREREVAGLIARGMSDRQIAEKLTITVGTVGVHVHRILDKLGVHSRWQVADWVARDGRAE